MAESNWLPEDAFREICSGNADAFEFCQAYYDWIHAFDDMVDKDVAFDQKQAVFLNLKLIKIIARNKFVQQHFDYLFPLMVAGTLAWINSEDWKKRDDVLDRVASQVFKSYYQELFFGVAFLVGGFRHAEAMSSKFRHYGYDPTPPPTEAAAP